MTTTLAEKTKVLAEKTRYPIIDIGQTQVVLTRDYNSMTADGLVQFAQEFAELVGGDVDVFMAVDHVHGTVTLGTEEIFGE